MLTDLWKQVSNAARSYESRWTLHALRCVDPELHALFLGQVADWEQAAVTGSEVEAREQAAAMCRGWAKITERMQGIEPDAYMVGQCPRTGLRVRITNQLAVADDLVPGEVIVTPDEVALLLGAERDILSVKQMFNGATLDRLAHGQETTP